MSLHEAAQKGDQLETLRTLRDFLARQLDECDSKRDVAALTGRLESVLGAIAALEPKEAAGDGIDEIAQRRAARRPGTAARPGSTQRTS